MKMQGTHSQSEINGGAAWPLPNLKNLKKGNRVFWRGDDADGGTITGTSWDAVTIAPIVDNGATTTIGAIEIDTSQPGTHTVEYVATDQNSIESTAARTWFRRITYWGHRRHSRFRCGEFDRCHLNNRRYIVGPINLSKGRRAFDPPASIVAVRWYTSGSQPLLTQSCLSAKNQVASFSVAALTQKSGLSAIGASMSRPE
jgi:hypothetical protein